MYFLVLDGQRYWAHFLILTGQLQRQKTRNKRNKESINAVIMGGVGVALAVHFSRATSTSPIVLVFSFEKNI